jgi:hypothetical protein
MTPLCELAEKYGTDKGPSGWNYTPFYYDLLDPRQYSIRTVLEIGVYKGASLHMWRDFFPNATVHGVDNDSECLFMNEPRIQCWTRDAYDPKAMSDVLREVGPIDLFVDDAIHHYEEQLTLLHNMWPHIAPGGTYLIEETNPWSAFIKLCRPTPDVDRLFNVRCYTMTKRWDIDSGNYSLTVIRKAS